MNKTIRTALCLNALLLLLLTGCSSQYLPDHVKDTYPGTFGLWEIGHDSFVAIDESRDQRSLKIDVWYPVDDEDIGEGLLSKYALAAPLALPARIALANKPVSLEGARPLVIFSHGYLGINIQSTPLMETLASHGYIVAAVEHAGNSQDDPSDSFDDAASKRVPDVSFVIDLFFGKNKTLQDPFHQRIDESSIAVVGHSFGGMTAIGSAAGWAGADPDQRVKAIVAISGVIDPELQNDERTSPNAGFTAEQLGNINIPAMLIGGTEDTDVLIENNDIALAQIPVPVYKADIFGANHTHFANVCDIGNYLIKIGVNKSLWPAIGADDLTGPYNDTCLEDALPMIEANRLTNLFTIAFLNRHLMGLEDTASPDYLDPDYINSIEENAELTSKI